MKLRLYSLRGVQFEGDIISFNVKTTSGEITVLDHHKPLVSVLQKGTAVAATAKGEKKEFEIASGFLQMNEQNQLSVLVD